MRMAVHETKKGLDLPITGVPSSELVEARVPSRVALVANDYHGMRPTFLVKVGDSVKRGQALYEDKKTPGVLHTAPAAGTVIALNRGDRRALQSVVIELNDAERAGKVGEDDLQAFNTFGGQAPETLSSDNVRALLVESGLWTALRTRPFSRVPAIDSTPQAIFVNAMDTNPLAPPVLRALEGRQADLNAGLRALSKLTPGRIYLCRAKGAAIQPPSGASVQVEEFSGPHPSGTVGLHIHKLHPVGRERVVWHCNLQDVLAVGLMIREGKLDVHRLVSIGGPGAKNPRLLRIRLGAALDELTTAEKREGDMRVISGSVLSGRTAQGEIDGYLGRYHQQITILPEGNEREFLGWLSAGLDKFSVINLFISKFIPGRRFDLTTSTHGSRRAMVPIGLYEKVMPMDVMPTHLLRSLIVNDIEKAEALGCLEMDEEDLSLCTFVCPGKHDYGPILRRNLTIIEKEG